MTETNLTFIVLIVERDGLYRVETSYFCAGFVVENSKVTECAPILRKRLSYWMIKAERISD